MDMRCPLPCHLSGSRYTLVRFGKEKASFQSRARVAKKNLLYPYPCLGCAIGPSLPGTFPTECPVSAFKPRTNWDGWSSYYHPTSRAAPCQIHTSPVSVVVSHQVMSDSCDPMDCSLPGSSVHGISQRRILEWVAISFSWGSSLLRDLIHISCTAGGFFPAESSVLC